MCGHDMRVEHPVDGIELRILHDLPIPIRHLYDPPTIGDDHLALHSGGFEFESQEWDGIVRPDLSTRPQVLVDGARPTTPETVEVLTRAGGGWSGDPHFSVLQPGVPLPPSESPTASHDTERAGTTIGGHQIGRAEVGSGDQLDRVSFMVPNGWSVHDGYEACASRTRTFSGGVRVDCGGWNIRIEPRADTSASEVRDYVRSTERHTITHLGELRRSDGSVFSSQDAEDALATLNVAMSIFLARHTAAVLPVGWNSDAVV